MIRATIKAPNNLYSTLSAILNKRLNRSISKKSRKIRKRIKEELDDYIVKSILRNRGKILRESQFAQAINKKLARQYLGFPPSYDPIAKMIKQIRPILADKTNYRFGLQFVKTNYGYRLRYRYGLIGNKIQSQLIRSVYYVGKYPIKWYGLIFRPAMWPFYTKAIMVTGRFRTSRTKTALIIDNEGFRDKWIEDPNFIDEVSRRGFNIKKVYYPLDVSELVRTNETFGRIVRKYYRPNMRAIKTIIKNILIEEIPRAFK